MRWDKYKFEYTYILVFEENSRLIYRKKNIVLEVMTLKIHLIFLFLITWITMCILSYKSFKGDKIILTSILFKLQIIT